MRANKTSVRTVWPKRTARILGLSILIAAFGTGCDIYQTLVNLTRLQFRLGAVSELRAMGISLAGRSSLSDFSALDGVKIATAMARGEFPLSFILNLETRNPNDGTGGYARTDATLKSFAWRLELDGQPTVSGDIDSPVSVPGTGEITTIPLRIEVDLKQFFKDRTLESLMDLALSLGGASGSSGRIALFGKPVVGTPIGDIKYPGEIKIVEASFTN